MSIKLLKKSKVDSLIKQSEDLKTQLEETVTFLEQIRKGNFQADISKEFTDSELGQKLISIKDYLQKNNIEERERQWLSEGLTKFSDILRNKDGFELSALADLILSNLIKYVGANQGAIFVLEGDEEDQYLKMLSCYAYDRKKFIDRKIPIDEGLIGQCVLEKENIYLKEIPDDYVNISSGLGEANPNFVLISPLLIRDSVFGVLELASFNDFDKLKMEFITRLSENIAATIKNVKDNERNLELLRQSQQQAEELRAQEEEMRQNMEELQATQEEMARKSNELESTMAEMEGIITGINATMATIEFKPDGSILTANENFLKAIKYKMEEIKGKHHKMFVPEEIVETKEYQNFWKDLALGKSTTGIFKRIASDGNTVWLNAIYNPIRDANGNVTKVVKFATDITEQQEMLAENEDILSGINSSMATIEFKPDGTILSANENFLRSIKYKLEDIIDKHHRIFVPEEIVETEEYKNFWENLARGESTTGVFKRVASDGNTVWLNAIYNPIRNANGQVTKIMKIASDVTDQQEKLSA